MSRAVHRFRFLFPAILAIIPVILYGQANNRVSGILTDPSGAVISGADITARNLDTNVVTTSQTNDSGYYVLQLTIGTYSIQASKAGFRSAVRKTCWLPSARISASISH